MNTCHPVQWWLGVTTPQTRPTRWQPGFDDLGLDATSGGHGVPVDLGPLADGGVIHPTGRLRSGSLVAAGAPPLPGARAYVRLQCFGGLLEVLLVEIDRVGRALELERHRGDVPALRAVEVVYVGLSHFYGHEKNRPDDRPPSQVEQGECQDKTHARPYRLGGHCCRGDGSPAP